ncbi:hypothetical protein [Tenacibaculum phage Larrie]|nr:hypothetical protein [Tenacibaculum phage Larrie]
MFQIDQVTKRIILIIYLLTSFSIFSQRGEVSIHVPLKTFHFSRKIPKVVPWEGGNYGAIVSVKSNKFIYSGGFIENSFGKISFVGMFGVYKDFEGLELSFNVGLASNYKDAYFDSKYADLFLADISAIPVALGVVKIDLIKNFGLQLNISPYYVNSGIYLNL